MDQVDDIILQAIKSYGFELDEDTVNISSLHPNLIFQVVIYCLKKIDESVDYPDTLPRNMAGRVSLATQVCETIKSMGYRSTIAYAQLLYADADNNRRLLSWLIGMMPSTEEEGGSERTAADLIQDQFSSMLRKSWQPSFSRPYGTPPLHRYVEVCSLHTEFLGMPFPTGNPSGRSVAEKYVRTFQPVVSAQPAYRQDAIPSLLEHNCRHVCEANDRDDEWNTLGLDSGLNPVQYQARKKADIVSNMSMVLRHHGALVGGVGSLDSYSCKGQAPAASFSRRRRNRMKGTRFMHQVDFAERNAEVVPEETEEEAIARREAELADLDRKIGNANIHLQRIEAETAQFEDRARQAESRYTTEQQRMEALRKRLLIMKKVLDLLPNGEENVVRLRELADKNAERLMNLAIQWEKVRAPLIEEYRNLHLQFSDRKGRARKLLLEVKKMRAQMSSLANLARERDGVYKNLAAAFAAMPSNISREVYTDRILDIVRQVKKQKVDIDKILRDTRDLQQEVNTVTGKQDRSFLVAQELVFQSADATKDAMAKEAYRLVVSVHKDFETLSTSVRERGQVRNRILQTEEQMQNMGKRIEALRLAEVQNDLVKMQTANQALLEQLKEAEVDVSEFAEKKKGESIAEAASKLIRLHPAAAADDEDDDVSSPQKPEDEVEAASKQDEYGAIASAPFMAMPASPARNTGAAAKEKEKKSSALAMETESPVLNSNASNATTPGTTPSDPLGAVVEDQVASSVSENASEGQVENEEAGSPTPPKDEATNLSSSDDTKNEKVEEEEKKVEVSSTETKDTSEKVESVEVSSSDVVDPLGTSSMVDDDPLGIGSG